MERTGTVHYKIPFGGYTHKYEYGLLFSLRQRKFIGRPHLGAEWAVEYNLLPGKYLEFEVYGYRDERPFNLTIRLIQVTESGRIETLKEVQAEGTVVSEDTPSIIAEFLSCVPGYHGMLHVPETVFSQEDVDAVMRILMGQDSLSRYISEVEY